MSLTEPAATAPAGLAALEERLRDDLVALGWPAKAWIPPSTRKGLPVHDVLVIGAGQAGLALSMALHYLSQPKANVPGARRKAVQALAALRGLDLSLEG
mgnify:CR=1 FL=1